MKQLVFLALLAIAAMLSSCGSNPTQKLPTSANWQAQLTGGTGPAAALNFGIKFNLSVNKASTQLIEISEFSFTEANPCFSEVTTAVGSSNLTNNLNTNQIKGSIVLTVTSETGNVLTLSAVPPTGGLIATSDNGVITNGAASGVWTLTPSSQSACSASGSFTMLAD
jgi:hypothetical protein